MRTNLIQSYLNTPRPNPQNNDKVVKDFDVHKELANRTFIKPLPSNGKLVDTNISNITSETWKDIKYDASAFKHAIKGEANDYELGRLNDVGMKLGGLAIAGYLFTKKQTPMTKLFEFVGLTTFFASMSLWPKLFLQLPAYLIHGVNIRKEYQDNYGRKKMFYQDHQFIPWDLYSDKEINKIGDKLRVPKDIPNRREYIQEKMRKIALQNNTLWMLTAGFATPLMSALMCNALEKPISKYLDNKGNAKADNLITNLQSEVSKFDYSKNTKALNEILSNNTGKTVTPEVFDKIFSNLSHDIDPITASSIKLDLERLIPSGKYKLTDDVMKNLHQTLTEHFKPLNLTKTEIEQIIPSVDVIKNAFEESGLRNSVVQEFSEPMNVLHNLLDDNIIKFVGENFSTPRAKMLNLYSKKLGSAAVHGQDTALQQAFKSAPANILTENMSNVIKDFALILNDVKAQCKVFDKFSFMKVAQAPETVLANSWNNISDNLMKIMKFSTNEINEARIDREIANKVLRNKLETIAADKETFVKFVDDYSKLLSEFETKMGSLLNTKGDEAHLYHKKVAALFDSSAERLRTKGLFKTANSLAGYDESANTSLKGIYMNFVTDRVKSVKYSFYRFLDTAIFYNRIAQGYNLDEILPANMYREAKEEAVELAKSMRLEGHTSDTSVKLFQNRYLFPNKEDCSQIEIENGKVKNKYYGTRAAKDMIEFSNDNEYFEKVMKMMFGGDIPPEVADRLRKTPFYEDFLKYRQDALKYIGGDQYFAKPHHLVNGEAIRTSSLFKFTLMGCSPDEMFYKLFSKTHNSKKWFSMVGKVGGVLIGATLLAQFFIGKTKDPKEFQQEASK